MIPSPYALPRYPKLLEGAVPESNDEVHFSVSVKAVAEQQVLVQPRTVRPLRYDQIVVGEGLVLLVHVPVLEALLEVPGVGRSGPVGGDGDEAPQKQRVGVPRRDQVAVLLDPRGGDVRHYLCVDRNRVRLASTSEEVVSGGRIGGEGLREMLGHGRFRDQRLPRSTTPPPGRSAGLAHCTSVVLELRQSEVRTEGRAGKAVNRSETVASVQEATPPPPTPPGAPRMPWRSSSRSACRVLACRTPGRTGSSRIRRQAGPPPSA